ncbi:MAG: tetratricopeptide repeat protein, partial [Thermoflexus sp.]|nr:tetratricopeptide repeat protein [Thermoflexus sp.]
MTRRRRWLLWLLLDLLALAALFALDWQLQAGGRAPAVAMTPTPTLSAAHYARQAEAAYRAGELRSAEEAYRLALALEPENPARYPSLIRLLVFTNRLEEAAAWLERGRRLDPEDPHLLGMAALILDWQGRIPEAVQAGEQAIARLPGEAALHAYLAEAYADAHRPQAALAAAQKALSLAPDLPDAHRALGYVYETLG